MRLPAHLRRPLAKLLGLCVVAGALLAGMIFPIAAGIGLVAGDAGDSVTTVSAAVIDSPLPQATILTDSQDRPIAALFDQNRESVTGDEIAPAMKGAMVAVEDRRFYQHQGVDWPGTMRAVVANSASGDVVQGASTISQQYIKNYLLYVDAQTEAERLKATEQTPARKLKEARIALQMERSLAKDEILTRYLNVVFWGNNAYGVKAASRTYFATTPDKLTVAQAALLAGMVRSPSAFDPVVNAQAARDRRNLVITQMRDQGIIPTDAQAREALAAPLGVVNPLNTQPNGCIGARDAGFFCKYVVEYLNERGLTTEDINRGGYRIRTTLDNDVLAKMKASLDAEVPPGQPNVANVMSIVAPGKDKHRVLGMASSRTFGLNAKAQQTSYGLPYEPVNLGSGSVFKIFTAATALENGLGIDTQLPVPPSGYASPIYRDAGGRPIPVRNSGEYAPYLSMSDALAQSPNTAFIKLMERTKVAPVVDMAVRLGMRQLETQQVPRTDRSYAEVIKSQQQASFTLGVNPTSVLELANVGATLASGGVWCPPSPIESITKPDGELLALTEEPCTKAVEPGLANTLLVGMSKDDKPGGTAARAAGEVGWNRPMAGKTGTTQNNKSAAFFGVVPEMAGAVITFDNSSSPRELCDGAGAPFACRDGNIFGGKTPAETWFGAMTPILDGKPVTPLPATDPRYVQGGADKQVPDVRERSVRDARAILARAGFRDVSTETVENAAEAGTVVGQNPLGAALPGEDVVLQISDGTRPDTPPAPGEGSEDGNGNDDENGNGDGDGDGN